MPAARHNSLALLTDLYELTMAAGYLHQQMADVEAAFHLTFRENPFDGGFTVVCGLAAVIEWIEQFEIDSGDVAYLETITGSDGRPLFRRDFLEQLAGMRLEVDVDAIPEGTLVFPHEPVLRVRGPLMQAQILESMLLNQINFETLIATKAARVSLAARGDRVIEFGLRRAQGPDGALSASRASFIGGCVGTSNVLAGRTFGIPVFGTHAHSWVMSFESEQESFDAWAEAMPSNAVFLVDTYNSLDGVRHAVETGLKMRAAGHEMSGIRLDSGDLAYLSIQARKILDQGGFPKATITASNELDERIIASLKEQGAAIDVWGVGTRLVTAYDQPALGGVYKMTALRRPGEEWAYRVKLSEQAIKVSTPGILQVRRFVVAGEYAGDMVWDELHQPFSGATMIDPFDITRRKTFGADATWEDLLLPVFRGGKRVYSIPPLSETRERVHQQLTRFHSGIKRFINPHRYPVGLEQRLHELKTKLVMKARGLA